jgi:hypothetical protein
VETFVKKQPINKICLLTKTVETDMQSVKVTKEEKEELLEMRKKRKVQSDRERSIQQWIDLRTKEYPEIRAEVESLATTQEIRDKYKKMAKEEIKATGIDEKKCKEKIRKYLHDTIHERYERYNGPVRYESINRIVYNGKTVVYEDDGYDGRRKDDTEWHMGVFNE